MAGVRVTPEQATAKWVTRLGAATQEITQGVQAVQQAPGQAAAAKFQKWQQGLQENAQKWRTRVAAVSLTDWQNAMINVGIPRVSQGAQAKQGKYTAFAAKFFPHLEQGVQRIRSMPDTTFEDRVQRAVAMMQHNRQYSQQAGGSQQPGR